MQLESIQKTDRFKETSRLVLANQSTSRRASVSFFGVPFLQFKVSPHKKVPSLCLSMVEVALSLFVVRFVIRW